MKRAAPPDATVPWQHPDGSAKARNLLPALPAWPRAPRRAWRLAVSLVMLLAPGAARPDDGDLELAVKATYLCKLPAFVAWPASLPRTDEFILCVVGRGPFGALLDSAAAGQTAQQRPIAIRRYPAITANPGCDLMFVAGSDARSVASVLAAVRGAPVLTVTDGQTDAAAIGIVNLVLVDGHVRFEIDQRSAADNGLVISSKLLSLAVRVRDRVVQ